VDGTLAGLICFEDKIREDSHQVIDALSKQGISVYMLSGDKESAAVNVASIVGIPIDKVFNFALLMCTFLFLVRPNHNLSWPLVRYIHGSIHETLFKIDGANGIIVSQSHCSLSIYFLFLPFPIKAEFLHFKNR
jgi:magnesium-transporting ATPase (P-type)